MYMNGNSTLPHAKPRRARKTEACGETPQATRETRVLPRKFHAQVVDFPHIARGKKKTGINSKVAKGAKPGRAWTQ